MSDDLNLWSGLRVQSQVKRSQNRANSAELLRRAGVQFDSHNMGAHLVVKPACSDEVADFWPGTGKWIVRGSTITHTRGVKHLMAWCNTPRIL